MQPIERQPVEVRKAYAIAELVKIVSEAATVLVAKDKCRQKLIELVEAGVVREAREDVLEIKNIVLEKITQRFTLTESQIKDAKQHFDVALDFFRNARVEMAINEVKKAIELNPTDPQYHLHLGHYQEFLGNYEDAVISFKLAVEIDPLSSYFQFRLGRSYFAIGNYSDAVAAHSEAVRINPNESNYQDELEKSIVEEKRMTNLIDDLLESVDTSWKNTSAWD